MWDLVEELRAGGVTIILTTHYIEEAQAMADRIGVIDHGKIIVVEEKAKLMQKLGKKQLVLSLDGLLAEIPSGLGDYQLGLDDGGRKLVYTFDATAEHTGVAGLLKKLGERGILFKDLETKESTLEEIFVGLVGELVMNFVMNYRAVWSIYKFEMARFADTIIQSLFAPVISTSLYFIVFGSAIGSKMTDIDGVGYGAFLVPGLTMLTILTESISNASFAIYMPKFQGTIYEILSAPVSAVEIVLGYVGASVCKAMFLGAVILGTARVFVPYSVLHPVWMVLFLLLHRDHVLPLRIHHWSLGGRL